jgi:hypothetical protein
MRTTPRAGLDEAALLQGIRPATDRALGDAELAGDLRRLRAGVPESDKFRFPVLRHESALRAPCEA